MTEYYDVVVIGAGPAGLSASSRLTEMGVKTLVLDEQPAIGGQIYRNITRAAESTRAEMGTDYTHGDKLAKRFQESGCDYLSEATVWDIDTCGWIYYSRRGVSSEVRAGHIIIATGAMERPVPFPGWNLPGVFTVGGINNLNKEAALSPDCELVIAGSGPLFLFETSLLIKKGAKIKAILETTPKLPSPKAATKIPPALRRMDLLWKGIRMLGDMATSKISYHRGITGLKAIGEDRVSAVEATVNGELKTFKADMLLTHFGVIPNVNIFRLIKCKMDWNRLQRYWHPVTDEWGRTSFKNIFAAGDGANVSGGLTAEYRGELTALELGFDLGIIPAYERDDQAWHFKKAIEREQHPHPLMDAVFAPTFHKETYEDDTVLCRCENISVGDVRKAVREGVQEMNELKIVTRSGMGPCQGKMCSPALAEIMGNEISKGPEQVGALSIRPPLKPLPLGEIAALKVTAGSAGTADLFKNAKK